MKFSQTARRPEYLVPGLSHARIYETEGVPGLFSVDGYHANWTNYQKGLLDKLNGYVGGTNLDNLSPMDVAIATARQADLATVFNLASQAHNNHFFFRNLSPFQTAMPSTLTELVRRVFTTTENFKAEFLMTASSLFGSGWVWLVFDDQRKLRILATYNAGTPHGDAYRRQNIDLNTMADPARGTTNSIDASQSFELGRTGSSVTKLTFPMPLLCCKVWEHAWIPDYGVDGKEKYLEAWWNAVDWNAVEAQFPAGAQLSRSRLLHQTGFVEE